MQLPPPSPPLSPPPSPPPSPPVLTTYALTIQLLGSLSSFGPVHVGEAQTAVAAVLNAATSSESFSATSVAIFVAPTSSRRLQQSGSFSLRVVAATTNASSVATLAAAAPLAASFQIAFTGVGLGAFSVTGVLPAASTAAGVPPPPPPSFSTIAAKPPSSPSPLSPSSGAVSCESGAVAAVLMVAAVAFLI